jgi:hypothetical protein
MLYAPMAAMVTVPADLMTCALAILELTVSPLGHLLIALEELAQKMLHGLELSRMLTMLTLLSSALTKVSVTVRPVNASASPTTKVLLANEPLAPTVAAMPVFATLKINLPARQDAHMMVLGMLTKKLDAFAILDEEALTVH